MVTVSNIATEVLAEENLTVSDISLENLEKLIDRAIDTVNLRAGTSIADLSGSAEAKSITGSESEILVVKEVTSLVLRAYKEKGPNTAISGQSVSAIISDPHYEYYSKAVLEDINRLRGRSFKRT